MQNGYEISMDSCTHCPWGCLNILITDGVNSNYVFQNSLFEIENCYLFLKLWRETTVTLQTTDMRF